MAPASYKGLRAASAAASRAAHGSSKKQNTKPELLLRQALRRAGLRGYRVDLATLPGRPDIVFSRHRIVVFCDGDFWHGRDLAKRLSKLQVGHNAPYWVAKISGNVERDRRRTQELEAAGWTVLRFWESAIKDAPDAVAAEIAAVVQQRAQALRRASAATR